MRMGSPECLKNPLTLRKTNPRDTFLLKYKLQEKRKEEKSPLQFPLPWTRLAGSMGRLMGFEWAHSLWLLYAPGSTMQSKLDHKNSLQK